MKKVADMVAAAKGRIEEIPAAEAAALLDDPASQLVDIRDIRELWREGAVPGAFHAPRGMLEFWIDPESPYAKDIFQQERRFVFFCAGGARSALAARVAQEMGLRVAHITEGFRGWKAAGHPVIAKDKKP
ncbi:MAG: rhodanese-like domain-containing protein [Pseudomonadota bacterium]